MLFRRAAELGSTSACFHLSWCGAAPHLHHLAVSPRYTHKRGPRAATAEGGIEGACPPHAWRARVFSFSRSCYRKGEGVERSAKMCAKWAFRATMCPRSLLGAALTEEEEEAHLLTLGDTATRERRDLRELDERRRRQAEATAPSRSSAGPSKHAQLKAAETAPRRRGTGGGCSRCGGKAPWACWRLQGAKAAHMLGVRARNAPGRRCRALDLLLQREHDELTSHTPFPTPSSPSRICRRCSTPRARA